MNTTPIIPNVRNGNLHIRLDGSFTIDTAAELATVMQNNYRGDGNIFIHTNRITEVHPASKVTFNNLLEDSPLPKSKIYMTGRKGLEISCDATKVIIHTKKKGCGGKCKNCKCRKS